MEVASATAYQNGCDLQEDAVILYKKSRYSRAAALAILAEEEFSKAFLLQICSQQGRWDNVIFASLRKHSHKQSISGAMRDYFDWFSSNLKRVDEMNRLSVIKLQPAALPSEGKISEIIARAKATIKSPKRDYLKQDAFYVSLDEEANIKSTPSSISKATAFECLAEASKFKEVVEVLKRDNAPSQPRSDA